ncbi:MAG TPA: sigma 54-interacting transcriptional regulator [Negativicutes bacterium]|nr:sigma 54-interacting transcriptional regulator [Negativicutes bacterium]
METIRLKLPNVDRVGLVLDISHTLVTRRINIISMEVEPNITYLELEAMPETVRQEVMEALLSIPQITAVVPVDLMPHQVRTEQLKAVMMAVSDGIVAIDAAGIVTQYNPVAEQILHLSREKMVGHPLTDYLPDDMPLMETLRSGISYNNREIVLEQTKSHYLASGRPIFDQTGRVIGAVAVLKDISEIRELVQSVTGQLPAAFDRICHESTVMKRAIAMAKTIARGGSTVLLRGETGTGKEMFARAIHEASPRATRMFVPINCAAIPDNLLESELFGYEEGAFSGAARGGKKGLFEYATGGTILLDEVAELSSPLQAKLLRVLQDGKVRRVGGTREIEVDVRVMAATHRNLEALMTQGLFREDLYYRLNVIPLFLPPLRERPDDIPLLSDLFLKRFASRMKKPVPAMGEAAMAKLIRYSWPGNIRELENVLERAINLIEGTVILAHHVLVQGNATTAPIMPPHPGGHARLGDAVAETEREALMQAVQRHSSSRKLGESLGLSHTAVLKKMKKYGITFPEKS